MLDLVSIHLTLSKLFMQLIILGWVKSFAIFGNMMHNMAALDAFAEIIKVMNHTELWDSEEFY